MLRGSYAQKNERDLDKERCVCGFSFRSCRLSQNPQRASARDVHAAKAGASGALYVREGKPEVIMRWILLSSVLLIVLIAIAAPAQAQILPTPTPTPTATYTPTPTATPSWVDAVQLSNGDQVIVERRFTYGDITVALLLAVLLVSFGVYAAFEIITRYLQ